MEHLGKDKAALNEYQTLLKDDSHLHEIFTLLVFKYNTCKKTKEEQMKYILRKVFKFLIKLFNQQKTSGIKY